MAKEKRKNIAILSGIHEKMVRYAEQAKLKKVDIADTAIMEFLEKRGVKCEWPTNKVATIKV